MVTMVAICNTSKNINVRLNEALAHVVMMAFEYTLIRSFVDSNGKEHIP